MTGYRSLPRGWTVVERRFAGPFTTGVTYRRPDGRTVEWSSRWHRKHNSRLSRVRPARDSVLWAPHRASWWIAVLFIVGSMCFLIGPLPGFSAFVGGYVDAAVFFAGSIFFTAAAALQWLETINADRGPTAAGAGVRLLAWEPSRVDWWSSGIQLVGTVFFNITTFRALGTIVDVPSYDRLVWRPDAFGSTCFLVAGYLAYAEVADGFLRRPPWRLEGGLVTVNLAGCVAFGVAALAAYVVPGNAVPLDATISDGATAFGALGFLVGAILLLPEGYQTRPPERAGAGASVAIERGGP
ncbi:MAG TPA: hypothetical protein VFG87_22220 [Amycolatopsis sp.]|nr:hypothetical protein [Amycolatopsis sp.]